MQRVSIFRLNVALATAVMAAGAVMSYAPTANATVYNFEFDSFTPANLTVVGTITVVPNGANLEVSAIAGTITGTDLGSPQTINSIVSNPNFPNSADTPHNPIDPFFTYDDVAFSTDPHLDQWGVVFTTIENGTGYWNIWGNGPNNYTVEELTSDGFSVSEDGTLTSAEVGATPLPATLPLFAGGLGALGALGLRRKRKTLAA